MRERRYRYRTGDVVVESELALPLPPEPNGTPARVALASGEGGDSWIVVDDPRVGTAWLHPTERVAPARVWIDAGASAEAVQAFVQGLVVPTALQLAGAFFVHASSVVIERTVVAMVGPSGIGKSSLAGAIARAGHRLFGDDGLVLDTSGDVRPLVGSAPLRLHDDAVRALGLEPADFRTCPTSGKRWVSDAALGARTDELAGGPLAAVYFLDRGSSLRVSAMSQTDAVFALLRSEFHPRPQSRSVNDEPQRLEAASRIARAAPMRRLVVPASLERLGDVVAAIMRDLQAIGDE